LTVTSHGLQGFVLTNLLLRRWNIFSETTNNAISGVFGVAGMLPDILPAIETLRGNYGGLYAFWHDFSGWSFVPTIGLHQIEDWLAHDQVNGGWFLWVYFAEPIVAFAIVAYIWYESGVKWMWAGIGAFGLTWLVGLIAELL
jgi:hypothetical protein